MLQQEITVPPRAIETLHVRFVGTHLGMYDGILKASVYCKRNSADGDDDEDVYSHECSVYLRGSVIN